MTQIDIFNFSHLVIIGMLAVIIRQQQHYIRRIAKLEILLAECREKLRSIDDGFKAQ